MNARRAARPIQPFDIPLIPYQGLGSADQSVVGGPVEQLLGLEPAVVHLDHLAVLTGTPTRSHSSTARRPTARTPPCLFSNTTNQQQRRDPARCRGSVRHPDTRGRVRFIMAVVGGIGRDVRSPSLAVDPG